ncbi:MAG: DedA family protein [Candidatus Omnitrophica bacterium]|nr:DedA family protein [Candidatus Omnitrophota bacterium]
MLFIAAARAVLGFPSKLLRKLYDWTLHWAKTPQAQVALFIIAFIESSFFPIPPDVLLIAMVIVQRAKWFHYALISTIGSVLGALFGYFIGWSLFETFGKMILSFYHLEKQFEIVGSMYADNALIAVFSAAFTPIPYKVFTIAAGLFKISIPTLIVASILGRAGRFFLVSGLLRLFGDKISSLIEKYFDLISILFVAGIIGGYVTIKYLAH